jgi:serine/threonine protein kinase
MSFYNIQINDNLSFMLRERYKPRYLPPPFDNRIMSLDFADGGNSGLVIACLDTLAAVGGDSFVAVKKIPSIFYGEPPHVMKRILREIRLLRLLRGHPNVSIVMLLLLLLLL